MIEDDHPVTSMEQEATNIELSQEDVMEHDESPLAFSKPLTEVKAIENSKVVLECELNKPNQMVKWLKDGQLIKQSVNITAVADSYVHKLVIVSATLNDNAGYTCVCGDVSTLATLTVKELPLAFSKLLTEVKAPENWKVVLECELNKPNQTVKWLKDRQLVKQTSNVMAVADSYVHQLVIASATLNDNAEYTCESGDISTIATLTVKEDTSKDKANKINKMILEERKLNARKTYHHFPRHQQSLKLMDH